MLLASSEMSLPVQTQVQQIPPFGPLTPRRVLTLAAEQVDPVVRIAHRVRNPLEISERILFDHEFVLILAGSGDLILGQERCRYQPHDLLFIPPFLPHRFTTPALPAGEHVAVHFDFAFPLDAGDSALGQRTPYEVHLAPSLSIPRRRFAAPGGALELAFLSLVQEQDSPGLLSGLRTRRDMLAVLAEVLIPLGTDPAAGDVPALLARNQARIGRVLTFIGAGLHTHLDAAALAQAADMSVSRMNTVFRQATGYSPLDYVRRARVAEARRLLADPELSVKEIAARTGFEDSFHFSRVFRQIDGLSPTHYRNALLAAQPVSETAIR